MDYRAVLEAVVQTITMVLGEGCNIRLISEDQQWLQLAALYDLNHPAA